MPLYEYRCTNPKCRYLFEVIKRIESEDPKCPRCNDQTVKLLSTPSLKFKGAGFHGTDYTKAGPKKR